MVGVFSTEIKYSPVYVSRETSALLYYNIQQNVSRETFILKSLYNKKDDYYGITHFTYLCL